LLLLTNLFLGDATPLGVTAPDRNSARPRDAYRLAPQSGLHFALISRLRRPLAFYNLRLSVPQSRKVCVSGGNQLDWQNGAAPGPDESNVWVSRSESPYLKPVVAASPVQPSEKATRMDFLKPRSHRMNRRRRIYEGKAKVLYEGPEPGTLIQYFKDDATAFNAKKHEVIEGKGVLNNRISEYVFQRLNDIGVPTHFIRRINMREQLIREVEIIPLEVVVRNVAAGSLSTRLGLEEGTQLPRSIIEFY
jgi:hypothetical protein